MNRVTGISPTVMLHLCCWLLLFLSHNTNKRTVHCFLASQSYRLFFRGSSSSLRAESEKHHVVIVGGGWAGFTAAEYLSRSDELTVTLLDASPRGSGGLAGGWKTPSGRPVEAGIHGFWREYQNTFDVMGQIEGVDVEDVLTPYNPSMLVSNNGKVALAPVLGESASSFQNKKSQNVSELSKQIARMLPTPLDLALLAEYNPQSPLTPADRITGVGLLAAWADFEQENPNSWYLYDKYSAQDLFKKYAGVSDNLYNELVSPLLHVLPMAPGYDISAAAALSCFHVFALQSQGAFDVRWCKGSITDKIFNVWSKQLAQRGVEIRGSSKVEFIDNNSNNAKDQKIRVHLQSNNNSTRSKIIDCDSLVLAVGANAMGKITEKSEFIQSLPGTKDFSKFRGVTCLAVRLFLKPDNVKSIGLSGGISDSTFLNRELALKMTDTPVIVCGPQLGKKYKQELNETGFCIYDLQRLQEQFHTGTSDCAVLEVDFYRADAFVDKSDSELVSITIDAVESALGVKCLTEKDVIDIGIARACNAVSHFSVGSTDYSPGVKIGSNVYMCGDWIDRVGHASWSTEKSVVTAKQVANTLFSDLSITNVKARIIPAAKDTVQLQQLRKFARTFRSNLGQLWGSSIPPSPWMFLVNKINNNR